jgi:NAD(P)-dependent dehydrogenase (short-subunit alcohol dehydrogenase family)
VGLLEDQRAVVTGGASGIGRATCLRMAKEGARIAVLDRNGDGAREVAAQIGAIAYEVDVTDAAAVRDAVDSAQRELGGLTAVFNNAGIGGMSRLHEYPLPDWEQILSVNLGGVFNVMQATIPHLLEGRGGSIVNTASVSGVRPSAGEGPYAATKAGVVALTASAALDYGPMIRVNAVSPGVIRSALTEPWFMLPDEEERQTGNTPMGRIGEPEDIADVVVFLCSDLARFITGQNIVVDGGMTLHGAGVDGVLDVVRSLMEGSAG